MVQIVVGHELDLTTRGAVQVLQSGFTWSVIRECHSLAELLKQLAASPPAIIVCSDTLDPAYHAVALLERLQTAAPAARIVFIGAVRDGQLMCELLQQGAERLLT